MLRFIAKRWAKVAYVFRQETEAATNELNAGLSTKLAAEKRKLAAQLTEQADQMDARIKEVTEMEAKGYWLCEDGHEIPTPTKAEVEEIGKYNAERNCDECDKPMKLIERSAMTGQEKYESDRERKDAEDLAKQKRDQAKAEEENAANAEKTAKYFRGLAQNNRSVAEKIRRL